MLVASKEYTQLCEAFGNGVGSCTLAFKATKATHGWSTDIGCAWLRWGNHQWAGYFYDGLLGDQLDIRPPQAFLENVITTSPIEGFGNCDDFRRSVKISQFLDSKVLMVKFESQVELTTCVTLVTPISHCHPCSSFRDLVFPEVATQILSLHCSTAGRENTCISCISHFSRSLHSHIHHITCVSIYICVRVCTSAHV